MNPRRFRVGALGLLLLLAASLPAGELLVHGRVVDQAGQPVEDVEVEVIISDMRIRRPVGTESVTSGHGGQFTVVLGADYGGVPRLGLDFRTSSPLHRQRTMIRVAGREDFPLDVRLDLFPGIMARGRVVTAHGDPVADAQVIGGDDRINRTDGEGRFELYGLFPGSVNRVSVRAEGFAAETVTLRAPEMGYLDGGEIVLSTAVAASGRVFDPSGNPATRGEVIVRLPRSDAWMRETVDARGMFHFPAIPISDEGDYHFTAHAPGFLQDEREVPLGALQLDEPVTLNLRWGTRIRGVVRWPDGEPAPGGSVVLGDGLRERAHTVMTDEGGRFEIGPVEPGGESLLFFLPPPPSRGRVVGDMVVGPDSSATIDWPWGARSRLDLERDGREILMTRTDTGPGAMPGTIVYQGRVDDDGASISGSVKVSATGAAGEFNARRRQAAAEGLAGEWEFREYTSGGTPLAAPTRERIAVSPLEGWQEGAHRLGTPRTLDGRVEDGAGNPLANAIVRVTEWNRTRHFQAEAVAAADGSFELTSLPEGVLTVQLLDGEGNRLAPPVYLRAGMTGVVLTEGPRPADPVVPLSPE